MFSHRLDFPRRFQKSTPKMENFAFVIKAKFFGWDILYIGRRKQGLQIGVIGFFIVQCYKSNARILKAHSHSMSGGSI